MDDHSDLLYIPNFLRRVNGSATTTAPRRRNRHPGSYLTMPRDVKIKRATQAQVKAMVKLGWNEATARMKRREDAASIVRFQVRPAPRPIGFGR